jgi:hypothetical protein
MLYNPGSLWPSAVVHEHWPVSQRMIGKMGDYAWREQILTVFLACQITIKNVQVQLTVKGKTTPDSYTPPPKAVVPRMWLSWNEVFRFTQTLARPSVGRSKKRLSSDQWTRLHVQIFPPNNHATSQFEHGDDVMSTVDALWVVALAFSDGGGVRLQCVC